jgi:hypothetical protein
VQRIARFEPNARFLNAQVIRHGRARDDRDHHDGESYRNANPRHRHHSIALPSRKNPPVGPLAAK